MTALPGDRGFWGGGGDSEPFVGQGKNPNILAIKINVFLIKSPGSAPEVDWGVGGGRGASGPLAA